MKKILVCLMVLLAGVQFSFAQNSSVEQELKDLSKAKWGWMSEKNIDKLNGLFHEKSKFLHMSGTWNKDEELEIIKTGSIWYKDAQVHDVAVEVVDDVAVVWSRITLNAVVRENVAMNEFTVTETYKKVGADWKLLAFSFSSVRDTHKIKH